MVIQKQYSKLLRFTGNLHWAGDAEMLVITEEVRETISGFS